jgi:hypothetical protein
LCGPSETFATRSTAIPDRSSTPAVPPVATTRNPRSASRLAGKTIARLSRFAGQQADCDVDLFRREAPQKLGQQTDFGEPSARPCHGIASCDEFVQQHVIVAARLMCKASLARLLLLCQPSVVVGAFLNADKGGLTCQSINELVVDSAPCGAGCRLNGAHRVNLSSSHFHT